MCGNSGGSPNEVRDRVTLEEMAALESTWTRWLSDPEMYDSRAGGSVALGGSDTADVLRDGLRLIAAIREREAEVARLTDERGDDWKATAEAQQNEGLNAALLRKEREKVARLEAAMREAREKLAAKQSNAHDLMGDAERMGPIANTAYGHYRGRAGAYGYGIEVIDAALAAGGAQGGGQG